VESLLGSSQPPEVLEGEPERPEHPGYPPEPEPPVKPTLTKVSERVEFDHRWGKISEEDYAALCAEIEAENTRRVREWEDATNAWHKALDAYAQARRDINAAHEAAVEAWQASLDQHAEAVEAREAARLEWELGYEEHFADWTADVGVLVGDMDKTFPRSINGFPIFHAFLPLHKDDWKRIEAAIVREQDRAIDV
jgi:hypothetical protein